MEEFLKKAEVKGLNKVFDKKIVVDTCEFNFFAVLGLGLVKIVNSTKSAKSGKLKDKLLNHMKNIGNFKYLEVYNFFRKVLTENIEIPDLFQSPPQSIFFSFGLSMQGILSSLLNTDLSKIPITTLPLTASTEETLENISKILKITLMIYQKHQDISYYGCSYNTFLIPLCQEHNSNYSLLLQTSENPHQGFPFIYTQRGNVLKVLKNMHSLIKKSLNPEIKQNYLKKIETLAKSNDCYFIVPREILKFYRVNKQDKCPHGRFLIFRPICRKFHCVQCLMEHIGKFHFFEWKCLCGKLLSPKNFKEICVENEKIEAIYEEKAKKNMVETSVPEETRKKFSGMEICELCNQGYDPSLSKVFCQCKICSDCGFKSNFTCAKCEKIKQLSKTHNGPLLNSYQAIKPIINDKSSNFFCDSCNTPKPKSLQNLQVKCHNFCNKCSHKVQVCPICSLPI